MTAHGNGVLWDSFYLGQQFRTCTADLVKDPLKENAVLPGERADRTSWERRDDSHVQLHAHLNILWPIFGDNQAKQLCALFDLSSLFNEPRAINTGCTLEAELDVGMRGEHNGVHDESMFIDIGQLLQTTYSTSCGRVSIRLKLLNDCPMILADASELWVFDTALEGFGTRSHGKLNASLLTFSQTLAISWGDETPHEMIKGMPIAMNSLPEEQGDFLAEGHGISDVDRDGIPSSRISDSGRFRLLRFNVKLGPDSVGVYVESPPDCQTEISGLCLGPFQLGMRAPEPRWPSHG